MASLRVSYSSLRAFQTCQRLYYWSYLRRLIPRGRRLPLEFGSAWHLALSTLLVGGSLDQAIAAFNAAYADDPVDRTRTQATAKKMLTRYAEKYTDSGLTITADEQWLELPLVGEAVYVMKIDKLAVWQETPVVVEHKTTSGYNGIGAGYLKGFNPSLQLTGYIAGAQALKDKAYTTVLVDIAWVGATKPERGEMLLRYEEPVESWRLEEFRRLTDQLVEQIRFREERFEQFTPNWSACTQFGECAYRRLCTAAPSIREREITEGYTVKEVTKGVDDVAE